MSGIRVDLYSDTITKPTTEMRQFMAQAEVGNEQNREDPTVNLLTEMVSELLGKDDAVYLPSGRVQPGCVSVHSRAMRSSWTRLLTRFTQKRAECSSERSDDTPIKGVGAYSPANR